jgi:hypothetical protein
MNFAISYDLAKNSQIVDSSDLVNFSNVANFTCC